MSESLHLISATVLLADDAKVTAEWAPPTSIEWAPAGRSIISATMGNKAWTGAVVTGPSDVIRLDKQLQRLLAESKDGKRSRPYIDFDHKGGPAAAIPIRFMWSDGIRLEVEWTSAGRDAIAGRTYSYFSPELILGDDDHPEALPAPGPIGALVNTPAFQRIQRLAAANLNNESTPMTALLKAAVAKGFVPTGVEDDEHAADHFMKRVEAAAKSEAENATLKARLGVLERQQEETEAQRKTDAEAEVDGWIKAGHVTPEAREMVLGNLMANPDVTRKQYLKAAKKSSTSGIKGEPPVKAAVGYGDVTEEEDRIRSESNEGRRRIMRAEWYTREQTRHIRAANTIDAALIVPIAQEAVITKLGVALAPLSAFATTFSTAPMAPRVPQVVTIASASPDSVLRNATNFNQSFTTLAAKTVTPVQLTMPWNLTNANIQDGLSMTAAAEANVQAIAEAIMNDLIATIDATNFALPAIVDPVATWNTVGVKNAWLAVANARRRHLIVAPEIYAQLMSLAAQSYPLTDSPQGAKAYGFDGIWYHNDWARTTLPVAGLKGFVCDPQAIAAILGVPILAPGAAAAGLTSSTVTAPGAGASVQFNTWFSTDSRTPQMSYDVIFGSTAADTTAGRLIIPA
jgi:hypothetical protein